MPIPALPRTGRAPLARLGLRRAAARRARAAPPAPAGGRSAQSLGSPGDRSGTIPIAHAPRSASLSPLSERTIGEEPSRSSGRGYRGMRRPRPHCRHAACEWRSARPGGVPRRSARATEGRTGRHCKRSGGCRGWLPVANQPRERQPGRMSPPTSVDEAQSQERRGVMSISTPVPTTIQLRRGRLVGLIAVVAALAAAVTSALLVFAMDSRSAAGRSKPCDERRHRACPAKSCDERGRRHLFPHPRRSSSTAEALETGERRDRGGSDRVPSPV